MNLPFELEEYIISFLPFEKTFFENSKKRGNKFKRELIYGCNSTFEKYFLK